MQCLHTLVLCFVEFEHPYMLFCSEQVEARLTNSTISLKQECSGILLHSGTLRLLDVWLCGLSFMFPSFKSSQLIILSLKSLTVHTECKTSHFQRLSIYRNLEAYLIKNCCKSLCHCQGWLCTYSTEHGDFWLSFYKCWIHLTFSPCGDWGFYNFGSAYQCVYPRP